MENGLGNARLAISCTLVTNMKKVKRSFRVYGFLSVLLLVITRIYALFSHGVSSLSMEFMFLPTMIGGVAYLWIDAKIPKNIRGLPIYTWFTYTFHTSMALIVNRMFVTGILHIAGTDTDKLIVFDLSASIFFLASVLFLLKSRKSIAR